MPIKIENLRSAIRVLPALCILLGGCGADSGATPAASRAGIPASDHPACPTGNTATVELKLDQTSRFGAVRIRWVEVNDSRCPTGVKCVWQGEVVVDLEIQSGSRAAEQVRLVLIPGRKSPYTTVSRLVLRLLSVEPYPSSGVTPPRESFTARVVSCKI